MTDSRWKVYEHYTHTNVPVFLKCHNKNLKNENRIEGF